MAALIFCLLRDCECHRRKKKRLLLQDNRKMSDAFVVSKPTFSVFVLQEGNCLAFHLLKGGTVFSLKSSVIMVATPVPLITSRVTL